MRSTWRDRLRAVTDFLTPDARGHRVGKKASDFIAAIKLGAHDTAIDCGANVGEVTQRMADSGATIYAFEPNPHAFARLHARFANNPNVHCINKGVLDEDSVMRLYMHRNAPDDPVHWSTGSSLLSFKGNVDPGSSIEVEVIDLAEFVRELNTEVALLKLDVEGVECRVIERLIDTGMVHRIRTIVAETHEEKIPELIEETRRLRHKIDELRIANINLDWI